MGDKALKLKPLLDAFITPIVEQAFQRNAQVMTSGTPPESVTLIDHLISSSALTENGKFVAKIRHYQIDCPFQRILQ